MSRPSLWLDMKRPDAGLTPRDTTVTGAFVEDTGFGVARVQIPHDDPDNVVNVPAAPGVYAPGALVTVTLSSRGVPLGMTPPLHLPADVPLVGVGDEGQATLADRETVLAGAEWQVQAAGQIAELDEHLAAATGRLDNLGEEVLESGQTLAERLDALGTSADGKTRTTPATTAPVGDGEAEGDLWFQFADETLSTIVGTWIWSGTEWLAGKSSHEVIASVDVGSLTVVGEARLQAAVIEMLWVDVVRSRKITTDMLQVGSGDNLLPNPSFEDGGAGWSLTGGVTVSAGTGKGGTGELIIPAGPSQAGSYYGLDDPQQRPRILPGKAYRVSAWVRSPTAILSGRASIYVRWYDEALGAPWISLVNASNTTTIPADTWTLVEGVLTAPEGATRVALGLYVQSQHLDEVRWSVPALTTAADASLIVDGGILARHLTVTEEMWAKIANIARVTAGMIVLGEDARMTPEGLTLYAPAQAGQDPTDWADRTPVLQLTSTGARTVAVGNTAGEVTAALTPDGQILGQSVSVTGVADVGSLLIDGDPVEEVIDLRGGRLVAKFDRSGPGGTVLANTEWAVAEMSFTNPFNYPLQLMMLGTTVELYLISAGTAEVRWRGSSDGSVPASDLAGSKGDTSKAGTIALGLPPLTTTLAPGATWRVRVCVKASVNYNIQPAHVLRFSCISFGRAQDSLGGQFTYLGMPSAPVAPPASKKRYRTQYACTGWRTFNESGGAVGNSNYSGAPWQGYSPYASPNPGAMRVMYAFQNWVGDLAGAEIERIELFLGCSFTYANAGTVAQIGFHGATSTGSWSRYGGILPVRFKAGQANWFDIPIGNASLFKAGTIRGILLDPAANRDRNLYSRWGTGPLVRITYLK